MIDISIELGFDELPAEGKCYKCENIIIETMYAVYVQVGDAKNSNYIGNLCEYCKTEVFGDTKGTKTD